MKGEDGVTLVGAVLSKMARGVSRAIGFLEPDC